MELAIVGIDPVFRHAQILALPDFEPPAGHQADGFIVPAGEHQESDLPGEGLCLLGDDLLMLLMLLEHLQR